MLLAVLVAAGHPAGKLHPDAGVHAPAERMAPRCDSVGDRAVGTELTGVWPPQPRVGVGALQVELHQ